MSNSSAVLEEETAIQPASAGILSGIQGRADHVLPGWFIDQQRAAWTQFQSLPMPARTDQAWRFSNIGALDLSPHAVVV